MSPRVSVASGEPLAAGLPSSSAMPGVVAAPQPRRRPGHPFGPRLSSLIGRLGRFSAERPRAVLALCAAGALLCVLLLTTGVVPIIVETDSSKLWVPSSSTASQMDAYSTGFEEPRVAIAIISSRDGASMTQLPQIVEAVRLDERIRTSHTLAGDDYDDVCFRAVDGGLCPPSSIFTLWNNTDAAASKSKVSTVLPMVKAALDAAAGSLDVALSDYVGCIAQNPTDAVATFRMLRFVYPLADGANGTEWADDFQRATLHRSLIFTASCSGYPCVSLCIPGPVWLPSFENIAVDSVVPGSYDKELSGMSWDDLVLALYWLPMLAVGVPLYMAHAHGLDASEAFGLLALEVGAILLSITTALTLMAILGLTVSPMWMAAPLLAMGYGLDDMFVLLSAFSEARAHSSGGPVLLDHIQP
ncbi:hypothetical protein T492DRAFT_849066 [Pavlovales sp. CCMP2436]|nr:hypothetical protein T492DRAFT_849066 [Pavlovales sp. CCMP2436]